MHRKRRSGFDRSEVLPGDELPGNHWAGVPEVSKAALWPITGAAGHPLDWRCLGDSKAELWEANVGQ